MKRHPSASFLAAACAATFTGSGPAVRAQQPADAVVALLTKIDAARGAVAKGKDYAFTVEGTWEVTFGDQSDGKPVAQGPFREIYVGADLARQTTGMGPMGAMERGEQRGLVWEVDPSMGAKVHRGANAAIVRRFFGVIRGASPRDLYTKWEVAGTQAIDGQQCTVLRVTPAEGKPDTWYVAADGLVVRVDTSLPAPESADAAFGMDDTIDATIGFFDWKPVDGVQHPHRRTLHMGPATVTSVCAKIATVAKVEPAKFAPPDAVLKVKPDAVGPAFGPDGKPNYQVVERQAQPVASIRVKCKPVEIAKTMSVLLPEVMGFLTATGAKMAGPPFSRYHGCTADEVDIEAGIPVQQPIAGKGRVVASELPAGRAVTCWHVGPYEKLAAAHEALAAWLVAQKHTARGGVWEVYWTDPGMVPDAAKWRTQLFAPIE